MMVTFKRWKNVIFSGLAITCDAFPHINTPYTLYFFCVFGEFQTQNQPVSEKKHNTFS